MITINGEEFIADTVEEAVRCLCASSLDLNKRIKKVTSANKRLSAVIILLCFATYLAIELADDSNKRVRELQKQVDELKAQRDIPVGE